MGVKFLPRLYHGNTNTVTMVIPRLSRYYHGKTAWRKNRVRFYRGKTMVITVVLGWLFLGFLPHWFYRGNTTVKILIVGGNTRSKSDFWYFFGKYFLVLPTRYYRGDTRLVKPGQHRIFSLREGGSQFLMGSIIEILPWFYRGNTMVIPRSNQRNC